MTVFEIAVTIYGGIGVCTFLFFFLMFYTDFPETDADGHTWTIMDHFWMCVAFGATWPYGYWHMYKR